MSGLTLQTLYHLWNKHPQVLCERFFLPYQAMDFQYRTDHPGREIEAVRSLESGAKMDEFDWIAFSIHYEGDFPYVLWLLDNAKIPLRAIDRFDVGDQPKQYPLIIAGGSAIKVNPLPLGAYCDAIFLGEIESEWDRFIKKWFEKTDDGPLAFLEQIAGFNKKNMVDSYHGWWIPKFHGSSSFTGIEPIKRIWCRDLDHAPHPVDQIIPRFPPGTENPLVFGETVFLEINRGCPHGCHFCMTGQSGKPFRNRSLSILDSLLNSILSRTECRHVTLIGASVTDHPEFPSLCRAIIDHQCTFTVPSVRIDTLTPEIASLLVAGGMRTVTIAPETGSDLLRLRMNKAITNDQIVRGCQILKTTGVHNLKMYFLYGLPFETDDDLHAMVAFIKEIADLGFDKWGLRVSLNPFIPKPHTPFERYVDLYLHPKMPELNRKYAIVQTDLKGDVRIKLESLSLEEAYLQTVFSLGNGLTADLIDACYKSGTHPLRWYKLLTKDLQMVTRIASLFENVRTTDFGLHDWNHFDSGVTPEFLACQYKASETKRSGIHCADHCSACGICEHQKINKKLE
jgi:radical SAM superfamily enzyme YgiQ (UPF0313 family)